MNAVYRPYLVKLFGDLHATRNLIARTAACVRCQTLVRPKAIDQTAAVIERLRKSLEAE